jgi:RNA polymerase sigma factor (sigma-70 family)
MRYGVSEPAEARLTGCVMSGIASMRNPVLEVEPDKLLADRFTRGDAGAFDQLVLLYQERVTRLASRLLGWQTEVEDVVQDVFYAAFRNAGRFRGGSSLWTWLTVITVNQCRTQQRKRLFRWRLHKAVSTVEREAAPAADEPAIDDETAREVRSAVAALPAKDREVIVLYYLEHQPVAEISRMLDASHNAIEVRLHRARAKLRDALSDFMKD